MDFSVAMYGNSLFSKAFDIGIYLKSQKNSLMTRGKLITYVSTSSFIYELKSRSLISKLPDILLRG